MSAVTPLVDPVDALWPVDGPPNGVLEQLVLASHLRMLGRGRAGALPAGVVPAP
jgi:hypothetical protein